MNNFVISNGSTVTSQRLTTLTTFNKRFKTETMSKEQILGDYQYLIKKCSLLIKQKLKLLSLIFF